MKRLALLTLMLALTAPGSATALSIDFVAEASGNEGSGIPSFSFLNVDGSGIDLIVTARDLTDVGGVTEATDPYPYLDDLFSGRRGGLGVCQVGDCAGVPDDNLGWAGLGEVLILEFSSPVTLQTISLNNGDHFQVFSGDVGINVGASNPITAGSFSDIFVSAPLLLPNLTGTRFSFVSEETFQMASGGVDEQIYLDTITFVPEPSTGVLIGLSLTGMAIRRRHRA